MQIVGLCEPWKITSGAEKFVLQKLQFQKGTCPPRIPRQGRHRSVQT